jgi:D-sedoheptulose 7-phosphate isomerase
MIIQDEIEEHARVVAEAAATLPPVIERVIEAAHACLREGGKILVCGNGGSAADAQHLAAELVCRVRHDRMALPAVALTTDTSALTAISNDYGFENAFSRQVEALARPGDVLVAISTSGDSENVIRAARQARSMGCTVAAFTGRSGGRLAEHTDLLVNAPSEVVSRIQEMHCLCVHLLAQALEDATIRRKEGAS